MAAISSFSPGICPRMGVTKATPIIAKVGLEGSMFEVGGGVGGMVVGGDVKAVGMLVGFGDMIGFL